MPTRRLFIGGTAASAAAVAAGMTLGAGTAHAAPPTPVFGPQIEGYQPYVGQTQCDPTAKPGVIDIRDLFRSHYGRPDLGISRACNIGGQSEHKEGRALDYPFNAFDAAQKAQGDDLCNWLLATDQYGNTHALVRRMGIMYIIWNRRIWSSNTRAWRAYSGASPHTDHVHISFGWPGARRETTWWTGGGGGATLAGSWAYEWGGEQHAFGRGVDGEVVHWSWGPSAGVRVGSWGSQGLQGQLNGFAYHDQQHVFARSPGDTLAHWWWHQGPGVQHDDWAGECLSDPATFHYPLRGTQHVFAKGADDALFHWWWTPGEGLRTDVWGRQGFQGNPLAFAYGDQQHVFARSVNDTLAHWYWAPGQPVRYEDWGGECLSDPTGFVYGPANTQHVFAKGADDALFHWWWTPGGGGLRSDVWGRQGFQGKPVSFAYGNQQHAFARSTGDTLAHWWWAPGAAVQHDDWGGECHSDPAGFHFGPYNQQHVFAKAANGELFHWFYDLVGGLKRDTWGGQFGEGATSS